MASIPLLMEATVPTTSIGVTYSNTRLRGNQPGYLLLIPDSEVDSIRLRTMLIKTELIADFKRHGRAPYQPSAQRWE